MARPEERTNAIPKDLYPDAQQNEGGEAHDYVHRGRAQDSSEAFGKAVAEINSNCYQRGSDNRGA
jgi:hypothetical protein